MSEIRGSQSVIDILNKMFADLTKDSRGRQKSSLIYWNAPKGWKGTVYIFAYTPWKTVDPETNKRGYFALKYRVLKNGNSKLVKSVRFGKRKVARARAEKWYNEYYH